MAEKRRHQRINCAEKCLLYYSNSRYSGVIMDLSISGVLIRLNGFAPLAIMPGDACSLMFRDDSATSFFRYNGRVARVNTAGLGLELLEYNLDVAEA